MLGRMASAARLGATSGADLSSEAATKDANTNSSQAPRGTSDGTAGGTGITTAASLSAAAAAGTTAAQQHPNLIGIIVGKMAKIQREGRGRRYRVSLVHGVFGAGLRRNWYKFYVAQLFRRREDLLRSIPPRRDCFVWLGYIVAVIISK